MIWLLAGIGYILTLATIVRFFQFLSDTDRSIRGFLIPKVEGAELGDGILKLRSTSLKRTARRRRALKRKNR